MDHETMRELAQRQREAYAKLVEVAGRPGPIVGQDFQEAQDAYKEAQRAFYRPQHAAGWPVPHGVESDLSAELRP